MKKNIIPMALLCIALTLIPRTSRSEFFCQDFITFHVNPSSCSALLTWSFAQCATGTFFIEYAVGASPWYAIGTVNSNGNTGGTVENYQYTDNYSCPGSSSTVYYRIKYKSSAGVFYYTSTFPVTDYSSGCSCPSNHTTRCGGQSVPSNLTIVGDNAICASSNETYTLSSGTTYPITWSITSGSGLVSYSTEDPYQINISNSTSTGAITLNANIFGCRSFNKSISLGAPVVAYDGYLSIYQNPGDEMEVCQPHETTYDLEISPGCTVTWSQVLVQPGGLSWSPANYDDLYLHMWKLNQRLVVQLDVSNACGSVSYDFGFKTISCEPNFRVTPNPARSAISITPLKEASETSIIEEISVYDFVGRLKFYRKYGRNLQVTLNDLKLRSGTYILKVKTKGKTETHKVIIQ